MKLLSVLKLEHYLVLGVGPAIAAAMAYQSETHSTLAVAGVSVVGALATLRALFSAVPGAPDESK
jgi:hypothetical protein